MEVMKHQYGFLRGRRQQHRPFDGLHQHRIPVDLILFADTGGRASHTYAYLEVMDRWLKDHGMPPITRGCIRPRGTESA